MNISILVLIIMHKCCQKVYNISPCTLPSDCTTPLDFTILLDSSHSIGERDFAISIDWLRNVTRPLEFASGKTRVAIVTFSNYAYTRFYLDTYFTRTDGNFML